jgi:hypothetical protein
VQALGQLPELGQRLLEFLCRVAQGRGQFRVAAGPGLGQAQRERQRQQALLRAVVQVPLDPLAFHVAGAQDPRPRGPDFLQLRPDLGLQPGLVDGQPRRGHSGLQQL